MESGLYTEQRSHHDVKTLDNQTATLLFNTFVAPLPYVGSTLSGLKEYPQGMDHIRCMDTPHPHFYTSWNVHNRGVLTSFFSRESVADLPPRPQARRPAVTIISDGALDQVLRLDSCLTALERVRLNNRTMFLTREGIVLDRAPPHANYRSALYQIDVAQEIADSIGADPVVDMEDAVEHRIEQHEDIEHLGDPELPAERSDVTFIPARAVDVSYVSFQANGPTEPPFSNFMNQLMALTSTPEKQSTQPLLPTARTPLARDLPSLQMLRRHVGGLNASYIDTAPALRGLLYAFPHCGDAFEMERTPRHFLRGERRTDAALDRTVNVHQWPVGQRWEVTVMAMTLPAFTNHIEHGDTHLGDLWPVAGMDQIWLAVPVPAGMSDIPWFMEYLMCFVDTRVWAGRLSYRRTTQHDTAAGGRRDTHFTQIPHAHNVSVPGVHGLLLVFLDENITSRNTHAPGIRPEGMNIYPGSQFVNNFNAADYQIDITESMHNLINDYDASALRMCRALEFIETKLSCDMAFQVAFSLAADISSSLPESPTLQTAVAPAHRYLDPLSGAWTFGQQHLCEDNPRHTTSDINAGVIANRRTKYTCLVNGYNWASLTPMLQYSHSIAEVQHNAVIEGGQVVGFTSHWTAPTLSVPRAQYKCHSAGSVYRILSAMGAIDKNDYNFSIRTPAGLQSMLVLQATALTLSTTLYLTNNDIDRWMWANHMPLGLLSSASALDKVRTMTGGHVLSPDTSTLFAITVRNGNTIEREIRHYYGLEISRNAWALSVPVPYFSVLQWAAKFGVKAHVVVRGQYGNVSDDYATSYVEITTEQRSALPWYASTGNTFTRLPRLLLQASHAASTFVPISVENWALQTLGHTAPRPINNGYVSNTLCLSLRYHYRDVKKNNSLTILNGQIGVSTFGDNLWAVTPTEYPDPPNLSFLYKAVNSEASGVQKESPNVEIKVQHRAGPHQASTINPSPIIVEGRPEPGYVPVVEATNTSPRNSVVVANPDTD